MLPYHLLYETGQHLVLQTTVKHAAGQSVAPYGQFNLALHVGDNSSSVLQNRMLLMQILNDYGSHCIHWLNQTHSTKCATSPRLSLVAAAQDALIVDSPGHAAAIMTADCLPIVILHPSHPIATNIHAGWRGLLNGVVQTAFGAMIARLPNIDTAEIQAVIGTAIGPDNFEVGKEVYQAFTSKYGNAHKSFVPSARANHYLADLYSLATIVLNELGITQVIQPSNCSYSDHNYYSYRRQPITGRMVTVVAIKA